MSPIQWNPSIMATIETEDFGHYRGVATNQGSYKYYFNGVGTKVSGHYREVAMHSSGVAIKRGSTVNGITFFFVEFYDGAIFEMCVQLSICRLYQSIL